ncbi:MAG: hypothetical protein QF819_00285 [Gemmatimonadota bacterium]|jgi:hypothetical protein|nr:hypothetical protein [Gemmatimonadota bacterium]MDP6460756.1 hypothetical protein [Gemmatimonadota bacterium]MDP6530205.1 hypothetical protein [Gemmatimonadota bacterium]MDP6801601.1 hypothetical protein [Gemmatimonadota bacterium]MDP7030852.1 hypothetical protein [Gemmatimonadota bacterium]
MRKMLRALALLALAALPAWAEGVPEIARTRIDTTHVAVGGRLLVTADLPEFPEWAIVPPTEATEAAPFRLRSARAVPASDGHAESAVRMEFVPMSPGEVGFPSLPLVARGPDGSVTEVRTKEVRVTVASNLSTPSDSAAAPAPSPLLPALSVPRDWRVPVVLIVLLLAAAAVAWRIIRRRRAREVAEPRPPRVRVPLRPAWETALEELDRIAGADHVSAGRIQRQYVEVTAALRLYLEERYGVPALETTTADLLPHLRRAPIPDAIRGRVLSMLRHADLVKFAKACPPESEAREVHAETRRVVLDTTPVAREVSA